MRMLEKESDVSQINQYFRSAFVEIIGNKNL